MKIKQIISQNRRDFYAIYECEHCANTEKKSGYDDHFFHSKVIPEMACKSCKKTSPADNRAMTTKYKEGQIV